MVNYLTEVKQEEARERLTLCAFIGFQLGAGGDKSFGQYLEVLGLKESKEAPRASELTAEEAIAKAEAILASARRKHDGLSE